jgi:hypothetical protein
MKAFVVSLVALVMLSSHAYADPRSSSPLPSAPIPAAVKMRVFGIVDWSLAGSVVATRSLDWTSTERCLRRPFQQCREGELPTGLVKNEAGFAAYEAAVSALSILAQSFTCQVRGQLPNANLVGLVQIDIHGLATLGRSAGLAWLPIARAHATCFGVSPGLYPHDAVHHNRVPFLPKPGRYPRRSVREFALS